jgi:hypothetical protein
MYRMYRIYIFRVRYIIFIHNLFYTASRLALGPTQPPIQGVPGSLYPPLKWPEREADYSPPSIAEVENAWSNASTSACIFMACCLIKHTDNNFTDEIM